MHLPPDFESLTAPHREGWLLGFAYALDQYAIWNNGVQRIGALANPIKIILAEVKAEISAIELRELREGR